MQAEQSAGRFTGWHMLAVMVLFFGVIIGVNATLAFLSITSWTGLVVKNSYVASQEFNAKLATSKAQQAAGWEGNLAYESGGLRFTLTDGEGAPLKAEAVQVVLSRPIGVAGDKNVMLARLEDGSYGFEVLLEAGVWNAIIRARFTDQPAYEHGARFVVP